MSKHYPIPEHAERVFEGEVFDVYQWEQKMFDGTTQTFEKLKRPDTVQVIPILDNGNILVTKEKQPGTGYFTGLAGGRVEPGEDVEAAARRELLEETGYESKEIILWKTFTPHSKMAWNVYIFLAKGVKHSEKTNLDSGEKIEIKEISIDSFLNLPDDPTFEAGGLENELLKIKYDKAKRNELEKIFYG